jgi:hypothetical protein
MRQELPVSSPQSFTSAWPQSHSEYSIVRSTLTNASRIRLYRSAVSDVRQS